MPTTYAPNIRKQPSAAYLVNELKKIRRDVWALYCHVAELKTPSKQDRLRNTLNDFSERLIDYISLGHFGIYQRLLSNSEDSIPPAIGALYPAFAQTTEAAVYFNDIYDNKSQAINREQLERDLSVLGENLALRIDLEDKLCAMLTK